MPDSPNQYERQKKLRNCSSKESTLNMTEKYHSQKAAKNINT